MKILLLAIFLFLSCGGNKAKFKDKEIPDFSSMGKLFCFNSHLFYILTYDNKDHIIRAESDNGLPEKCYKIDTLK